MIAEGERIRRNVHQRFGQMDRTKFGASFKGIVIDFHDTKHGNIRQRGTIPETLTANIGNVFRQCNLMQTGTAEKNTVAQIADFITEGNLLQRNTSAKSILSDDTEKAQINLMQRRTIFKSMVTDFSQRRWTINRNQFCTARKNAISNGFCSGGKSIDNRFLFLQRQTIPFSMTIKSFSNMDNKVSDLLFDNDY